MNNNYLKFAQKLTLILCLLGITHLGFAQDVGNYSFTTNTNETLEDMSFGTTQLIGANRNTTSSAVTNIGFEVWFMGERFTQFSVNTNGVLRFGATVVSQYGNTSSIANQARVSAFTSSRTDGETTADAPLIGYQETSSTGKIHYKIIGTAPNRTLVVEWLNMRINHNSANSSDGIYQVHIYETAPEPTTTEGGLVRFIYGNMYANVTEDNDSNEATFQFQTGIGYGDGVTEHASVHVEDSPPTSAVGETTTVGGTTATGHLYTVTNEANITNLHSSSTSARRYFNYEIPSVTGVPSNATASCITTSTIDLSWSDPGVSNGIGVAVYRSIDGINYSFLTQEPIGTESYQDTGLTGGTTYYYRLYVVNEGKMSSLGVEASLTVGTAGGGGTIAYAVRDGDWDASNTWSTGATPDASTSVVISCNYTVTVTASDGDCDNLTIASGSALEFNMNGDINIGGDLSNAGTFDMEGTNISLNLTGNLTNTGTWKPGSATFTFDGSSAQTVSNTGTSEFTASAGSTTTTYTYSGSAVDLNGSYSGGGGGYYYSGISIAVGDAGTVTDINTSFELTHSDINDLEFGLSAPDGSYYVISTQWSGSCGNGEDNMSFTLDDESTNGRVEAQCSGGNPSVSGIFQPTSGYPLSNFDGESINGSWTLWILDYYDNEAGATFDGGSITITYGGGSSTETTNDLAFHNFIMNNANGVTFINDDARITNDLTLTSGVIAMGANEMIFIDGATSDVGGNSNHVTGKIRKIGNEAFDYPCGNGTYIANLSISAPSSDTDEFTCEYTRSDPDANWDTDSKEGTIHNVSRIEYWVVEHPVGSSAVYLSLSYEDTRSGGVGLPTDLTVGHWSAGQWADEGRNNVLTPANYTGLTTSIALSRFSPITLASTNFLGLNPLPITLVDFTAERKSEGALLEWQTAPELNSDYFAIERSLDGKEFNEIGTVEAKGETKQVVDYNFLDDNIEVTGYVYYRLRMVDLDGSFEYSIIRQLQFDTSFNFDLITIAPNPFNGQISIKYQLPSEGTVHVVMSDMLGRNILEKVVSGKEGRNTLDLTNLERLPTGTYVFQLHYNGKMITKKLIK